MSAIRCKASAENLVGPDKQMSTEVAQAGSRAFQELSPTQVQVLVEDYKKYRIELADAAAKHKGQYDTDWFDELPQPIISDITNDDIPNLNGVEVVISEPASEMTLTLYDDGDALEGVQVDSPAFEMWSPRRLPERHNRGVRGEPLLSRVEKRTPPRRKPGSTTKSKPVPRPSTPNQANRPARRMPNRSPITPTKTAQKTAVSAQTERGIKPLEVARKNVRDAMEALLQMRIAKAKEETQRDADYLFKEVWESEMKD